MLVQLLRLLFDFLQIQRLPRHRNYNCSHTMIRYLYYLEWKCLRTELKIRIEMIYRAEFMSDATNENTETLRLIGKVKRYTK